MCCTKIVSNTKQSYYVQCKLLFAWFNIREKESYMKSHNNVVEFQIMKNGVLFAYTCAYECMYVHTYLYYVQSV